MATRTLVWDEVLVDTSGAPVAVSTYNVYRDGNFVTGQLTPRQFTFSINPGEQTILEVAAVGPGGEGARSQVVYSEPSGIPVAPTGLAVS